jgi:hypothetical protein
MKTLCIVGTAYRATLEEQDDTVLWITTAMRGAGGDLAVLLRGSAVNYLVRGQDASGLAFGDVRQTQPPQVTADLARLMDKGVPVHYVQDELAPRGIAPERLVGGAQPVRAGELPRFFERFGRLWHW